MFKNDFRVSRVIPFETAKKNILVLIIGKTNFACQNVVV